MCVYLKLINVNTTSKLVEGFILRCKTATDKTRLELKQQLSNIKYSQTKYCGTVLGDEIKTSSIIF